MSAYEKVEQLDLLPDRLSAADFTEAEVERIKGHASEEVREAATNGFNWIAAYLCEEIGFYETELTEWFRSEARGLNGKTPLRVWSGRDGPTKVFEYAMDSKEAIDEDLASGPEEHPLAQPHRMGNHAIEVVRSGFLRAGMNPDRTDSELTNTGSYAIHNPKKDNAITATWRSSGQLENWRIHLEDKSRRATYYVVKCFPPNSRPFIIQTGIGRSFETDTMDTPIGSDSDLDGRPPSIGEVASFVVPLANEVKNGSLALVQPVIL